MKKVIINGFIGVIAMCLLVVGAAKPLGAQFKWTSDYKNLYNEKVAVELELGSVKRQFSNEKSNYESRIKQLEGEIDALTKKLAMSEKQQQEDRNLCDTRIAELEGTIDILQKKSGDREKNLIEDNKKMQARYEEELRKARQTLLDEREKNLKEMELLKKNYEAKIAEMQLAIKNLNEELSSLKKLTETQKAELNRMADQANDLEKQLKDEIEKGEIRLKKFHDRLIINIDDRISFDSGSSELKKEILPALDKITKILADYPEYDIVIEGHTDNVPIKTRLFRDNWQLSTERALAVLNYLLGNKRLDRRRFSAAGYGEYHPIVSNDTPANRSLNRRVDIVVVPRVPKQ